MAMVRQTAREVMGRVRVRGAGLLWVGASRAICGVAAPMIDGCSLPFAREFTAATSGKGAIDGELTKK